MWFQHVVLACERMVSVSLLDFLWNFWKFCENRLSVIIIQVHQQDAYPPYGFAELYAAARPPVSGIKIPSPQSTRFKHREWCQFSRSQNLTSASCDLDLWPTDPRVDRCLPRGTFVQICIEIGSFVFEISGSQFGNGRTDKRTCREHYASSQSRLAEAK